VGSRLYRRRVRPLHVLASWSYQEMRVEAEEINDHLPPFEQPFCHTVAMYPACSHQTACTEHPAASIIKKLETRSKSNCFNLKLYPLP